MVALQLSHLVEVLTQKTAFVVLAFPPFRDHAGLQLTDRDSVISNVNSVIK
jgi:hypothetical protein